MKRKFIILPFGLMCLASFPLVLLWMNNFHLLEDTSRVWKTLAILCSAVIFIWFILMGITKNVIYSFLLTVAVTFIFENGSFLQLLLTIVNPYFRYWHTTTILLLLIVFIAILLPQISQEISAKLSFIFSIIFICFIIFNVTLAIPKIAASKNEKKAQDNKEQIIEKGINSKGRNIYWLLFDEYSSNYVFEKYLHYDNSEFTNWLENKGFNVSYSSQNEGIKSPAIAANIANLGYVASYSNERTNIEDWELVMKAQDSAVIIPLAESNGYSVLGIGSADFYGFQGQTVSVANTKGRTIDGDDITDLFYKQTIIAPFMEKHISNQATDVLTQLQYLQAPENLPSDHTFIIAHFNTPHTPILFRADGSLLPPDAYKNIPEYYLGQCLFVNSQIKKIVTNIVENDPTSIIAIMSDHSTRSYPGVIYDDKRRIFAAFYNGGKQTDIEGYSGINVMITILNEAFGTSLDYVEPIIQEEVTTH